MTRGEIWLAEVGRKPRPVLVLTRSEVIDVRYRVTVAEITTSIRGLATEVSLDHEQAALDHPSVVNCDGLHTVSRSSLTRRLGTMGNGAMEKVCWAVSYALGC